MKEACRQMRDRRVTAILVTEADLRLIALSRSGFLTRPCSMRLVPPAVSFTGRSKPAMVAPGCRHGGARNSGGILFLEYREHAAAAMPETILPARVFGAIYAASNSSSKVRAVKLTKTKTRGATGGSVARSSRFSRDQDQHNR
jgi:hypothetical protein